MMRRGTRAKGWLLGIAAAVLAVGVGTAGTAKAAGITVRGGGIKQFGEPYYFYIFEISAKPETQFLVGDNFTLEELAGVSTTGATPSTTSSPGGSPSGPWAPVITNQASGPIPGFSPPTTVPFADVTFSNAFNVFTNSSTTTDEFMGEFRVLTAISLPLLPPDYTLDVNWVAHVHDLAGNPVTDTGTVTLHIITAIPEPSSIILLGVAAAGLPGLLHLRRRRAA
jgi:hypothetical protein